MTLILKIGKYLPTSCHIVICRAKFPFLNIVARVLISDFLSGYFDGHIVVCLFVFCCLKTTVENLNEASGEVNVKGAQLLHS